MFLSLTTNMAAVTSLANQQCCSFKLTFLGKKILHVMILHMVPFMNISTKVKWNSVTDRTSSLGPGNTDRHDGAGSRQRS